jgi:putative transposase
VNNDNVFELKNPGVAHEVRDALTEVLREGARALLSQAIEAEVAEYLARHREQKDSAGRLRLVRNGYLPERTIQTGIGDVPVKVPRVRDRAGELRFSSSILPPYLRRTKTIEELLPWLYLKGISTGDFSEALAALLGRDAPGLSAGTISRLKAVWAVEHTHWERRSLANKHYVYLWVDGIHFGVRLEEANQCILVVMGATAEGKKELVALADGFRESEQSWKAVLMDLKKRGLKIDPKLAIGERGAGFLEGTAAGLWIHTRAALLGIQDGQRDQQAAQASAGQGQKRSAPDLDGGHPRAGACGLRDVPGELRAQVSEGHRVPGQGQAGASRLL